MVTMTRRCPGQRSGLPERPLRRTREADGRAICRVAWMRLVRADGSVRPVYSRGVCERTQQGSGRGKRRAVE